MDKKTVLRNFREKMHTKFGKTAEDVINQKVFQLLKSPRIEDKDLQNAENDVQEKLKTYKPRKMSLARKKSNEPKLKHSKLRTTGIKKKKEDLKLPRVAKSNKKPIYQAYKTNEVTLKKNNTGIETKLSYGMSPHRQLENSNSIELREKTPINQAYSVKSSTLSAYRNKSIQERKNSTIWDAITIRDYEKFKREQDAKFVKKIGDQQSMRDQLDKQIKVVEFKKRAEQVQKQNDHNQLLAQLRKQDQETVERMRKRKQEVHDQVIQNFNLAKRKVDYNTLKKKHSLTLDTEQQDYLQRQAKHHDSQYLSEVKKVQALQKQEMLEHLKRQELLKNSNKALTKLDHLSQMNGEFDLIMKNQERYKKKIEELTRPKETKYINLAIAEKERERKLEDYANKNVQNQLQKHDRLFNDLRSKKQKQYEDLKNIHKQQMEEKQLNKRNKSSLEILNDKHMLNTIHQHEKEMILKEKLEAQNRKLTFKKYLDDHNTPLKADKFNTSQMYNREFELSKDLIKEISPNNSTIV